MPRKHAGPQVQLVAPKPLLIPSLGDEGRQPSMLEKTFSVESEDEDHPEPEPTADDPAVEPATDVEDAQEHTVLFTVEAKHNYTAQNEDEISFNAGDVMNVVSDNDPNWWVGFVEEGKVGYFPSNFVQSNQPENVAIEQTDIVEL